MSVETSATWASATVEVGSHSTHYLEAGAGAPIVLLHGSGPGVSSATNWSRTIPALAQRFRVLAPEMLGFGGTARLEGQEYSMDMWVDQVIGFLDAIGLDRACFVGNSLGGVVTLQLAMRYPERIERMVLMGAPGVGMTMTEGLKALRAYEPSLENMRELLTKHFAYNPAIVTDELIRARYHASAAPGELENYRAIHRGQVSKVNQPLTAEAVRGIDAPALVVHGREDRVVSPEVAWTMANLIPDAELHLFPRCGHWTQLEHADEFNRLVGDFFARGTDTTKGGRI
ncbi:alpha/beta fold hydrolase [Nocardia vaccinii]|uniref:alpha/beta fold hydrolase n=1 Tax=Nocardia vaccinii TaxID=1822 RepID=UPI000836F5E1|nr:alpha/beta hydrolase [Nocardia vaccinii]